MYLFLNIAASLVHVILNEFASSSQMNITLFIMSYAVFDSTGSDVIFETLEFPSKTLNKQFFASSK